MKKTPFILFVTVALAFAAGLVAQQGGGQGNQAASGKPNPEIVAKLREIISIRQRLLESVEVQVKAGRAPVENTAEIDLVEARIQLAREESRKDAVVTELGNLVAAHQRRLKRVEDLTMDRFAPAYPDQFKVSVLEAEVRLLREQK